MRSLDDPEAAVCLPMAFSASAPAATEMAHLRVFAIAYMHRQQMNLVNIRPTFWNHLKTSFRMPAAVEYVRPFRRPYNIRTEHKRILRVTKYQNIHAGQFKTPYTHTRTSHAQTYFIGDGRTENKTTDIHLWMLANLPVRRIGISVGQW